MTKQSVIAQLHVLYDALDNTQPSKIASVHVHQDMNKLLIKSALEYLEPHVLTPAELEEALYSAKTSDEHIFWAEARNKLYTSFGVFQLDFDIEDYYEAQLIGTNWPVLYHKNTYGQRWRVWSSKPDENMRKSTPWDKEIR